MIRAVTGAAIAGSLFLLASQAAQAQSAAEGVWLTEPMRTGDYAHVEVAPCAPGETRLCGRIVEVFNSERTDLVGAVILKDMAAVGQGVWDGGHLWSPDKDKHYASKMALLDKGLQVKGCVGALCKGQVWRRVR